ncbi:MAG: hypothetical protein ACPGWR_18940 [Ardenticatenaceae bacterium]
MILSRVVITGALGAGTLGAGVKAYREHKRKKEFPWTVAAERMARNSLVAGSRLPFGRQRGIQERVISNIQRVHAKSVALTQEIIAPFVDDTRKRQLADITSDTLGEVQAQKEAKKNLYVSSASLLLVSGGALFYTPLYVPGILGVLYTYSFFLKGAYHAIFKKRRANVDVFMIVCATGAIVGGFYFVLALGNWYGSLMRVLLTKTENHSQSSLINLFGEAPRFAWLLVDGQEVEVPSSRCKEAPTRRLAQELGIDHYFANTLPEKKADLVKQLLLCPLGYKSPGVPSVSLAMALTIPSPLSCPLGANKPTFRSLWAARPPLRWIRHRLS